MNHQNLDFLIQESRHIVQELRRAFKDPEDFDLHVKKIVRDMLVEYDYNEKAIKVTMKAIFGDE